jgi:Domain of unknown function (DUF4499)
MAKRSGVVRPSWGWFALLDGGIVALTVLASTEAAHRAASEAIPAPLPSQRACRQLLVGTAVIHLGESWVAGRMAHRRGLSPRGWRLQTLVVGFPSLLALRRVRN